MSNRHTSNNFRYPAFYNSQTRSILTHQPSSNGNKPTATATTCNTAANRVFTPNNPSMLKYFSKSASLAHLMTSPNGIHAQAPSNLVGYAGSSVDRQAADSLSNSHRAGSSNSQLVVPSASGFVSSVEHAILKAHVPIEITETDEITINGERGIYANKQEVASWKGSLPIHEYPINEDQNPDLICKRTNQEIEYVQELAIRYLRPPTPPAPGDIIINQEPNVATSPAPPLILRQQPPRPVTPEPLVIRECPPAPPCQIGRKIITISGKKLPPPPRKVIIERLAPLPQKPQAVLIERWLPYKEVKRRVVFNKPTEPDPVVIKPKNVIVQWDAPKVNIRREFKYLGVIRASPCDYVQRYGPALIPSNQLPSVVDEFKTPDGIVLAAHHRPNELHELVGDVDALGLIDLEREGLGGYRPYLERLLGDKLPQQNRPSSSNINAPKLAYAAYVVRPASKQKVSILETPTHQHTYAYPDSSLIADSSIHDQLQQQSSSSNAGRLSAQIYCPQTTQTVSDNYYLQQQHQHEYVANNLNKHNSNHATNNTTAPISIQAVYATPEQLNTMYPNLEHILAQYALSHSSPVCQQGQPQPRFQAPPTNYISNACMDRSVSGTSIGKRSVTSVTSLNGPTYSNAVIETIFKSIDRNHDGQISVEDAEKVLLRLNSRLGRRYGEDDLKAFFSALDTNMDGCLDFDEFRRAFIGLKI